MQNVAYNDRSATLLMGTWTFLIPMMFLRALIAAVLKIFIIFTGNTIA